MAIRLQCEFGIGEQKIKNQNTDNRRNKAVYLMLCNNRGNKYTKNINGNNIRFSKSQITKGYSNQAGNKQNRNTL